MFNLTCPGVVLFPKRGIYSESPFVFIFCVVRGFKRASQQGDLNADRVVVDVKYATHTQRVIVESPFVDFVVWLFSLYRVLIYQEPRIYICH